MVILYSEAFLCPGKVYIYLGVGTSTLKREIVHLLYLFKTKIENGGSNSNLPSFKSLQILLRDIKISQDKQSRKKEKASQDCWKHCYSGFNIFQSILLFFAPFQIFCDRPVGQVAHSEGCHPDARPL